VKALVLTELTNHKLS